uniref:Protein kinase domain-containing protein n=1 Tax=Palpitomonas bilix TaxID=652834 RepID=A0A7S3FYM4_9EUKA|mmetsp:Transcript_11152/g.29291  ORF Transcript_11152/g.29291 Transcript_11152/m.29291 type:complete len:230 (+) Transcript_11152:3-692(+)
MPSVGSGLPPHEEPAAVPEAAEGAPDTIVGSEKNAYLRDSPLWLSPEMLKGEEGTAESDMWAFGMLVYECITAKIPWSHLEQPALQIFFELLVKKNRPQLPPSLVALLDVSKAKKKGEAGESGMELEGKGGEGEGRREAGERGEEKEKERDDDTASRLLRADDISDADGPSEQRGLGKINPALESAWASVANFMQRCWYEDPSKRPTAGEAVSLLEELCDAHVDEGDGV